MRYWLWQMGTGVVTAIGLDMTGLEFGWKWVGICMFIVWGNQICDAVAGKRP